MYCTNDHKLQRRYSPAKIQVLFSLFPRHSRKRFSERQHVIGEENIRILWFQHLNKWVLRSAKQKQNIIPAPWKKTSLYMSISKRNHEQKGKNTVKREVKQTLLWGIYKTNIFKAWSRERKVKILIKTTFCHKLYPAQQHLVTSTIWTKKQCSFGELGTLIWKLTMRKGREKFLP